MTILVLKNFVLEFVLKKFLWKMIPPDLLSKAFIILIFICSFTGNEKIFAFTNHLLQASAFLIFEIKIVYRSNLKFLTNVSKWMKIPWSVLPKVVLNLLKWTFQLNKFQSLFYSKTMHKNVSLSPVRKIIYKIFYLKFENYCHSKEFQALKVKSVFNVQSGGSSQRWPFTFIFYFEHKKSVSNIYDWPF